MLFAMTRKPSSHFLHTYTDFEQSTWGNPKTHGGNEFIKARCTSDTGVNTTHFSHKWHKLSGGLGFHRRDFLGVGVDLGEDLGRLLGVVNLVVALGEGWDSLVGVFDGVSWVLRLGLLLGVSSSSSLSKFTSWCGFFPSTTMVAI